MIEKTTNWIFSSIASCIAFTTVFIIAFKFWPYLLFGLLVVVMWHLETIWNRNKKPQKIIVDKNYIQNKRKDELIVLGISAFIWLIFIFMFFSIIFS